MVTRARGRSKKRTLAGQSSLFPPMDSHFCIALDVETTGLRADTDRVLQLGVVLGDNNFSPLWEGAITIDPDVAVPENVVGIHGLSNQMVDGCVSFAVAGRWLAPLIQDKIVIGHNVGFDLSFLSYEYERVSEKLPRLAGMIDSLSMSRYILPRLRSHKLEWVCNELNIEITRSHDACYDALASLEIVRALAQIQPKYLERSLTVSQTMYDESDTHLMNLRQCNQGPESHFG